MNKYRVYGHTTVTVTIEVNAENEAEAYDTARGELIDLMAFVGNGGTDKLIGVDGKDQSVSADEEIVYDNIKLLGSADEEDETEDDDDE
jgi:hypothetical protein